MTGFPRFFYSNRSKFLPDSLYLLFLNVCSASPRTREWKKFLLSSSVSWLWFFEPVGNKSSDGSNFSDFPSVVGILVVRDLRSYESLLMLLLKLTELLLLANCSSANKIWSASIFAGFFFTAKLWLTCGARLLLFSWRSPKGAEGTLFLNSCHHVRCLFLVWLNWIASPIWDREHSGNNPRLVPGFLGHYAGTFPEWFRRISWLAHWRKIRLAWTEHPKYVTVFY